MSGVDVIGGISAVIAIIQASIGLYNGARKDLKLSEAFEATGRQLPIILDTLRTCENHLEPIKGSLPIDACEALEKTLNACEDKAEMLKKIFEKVIPGENDGWNSRYLKILKRLGKGNKVEELMISITEAVKLVVNFQGDKSATLEQITKLEDIIKEMKSVKSSVPEEESSGMNFNSGGGNMENYVNQDKGFLVVNREKVQTQHFGNGKN